MNLLSVGSPIVGEVRTAGLSVLGLDNCKVLFEFRSLYIDVYIIGQSFLKFLIF